MATGSLEFPTIAEAPRMDKVDEAITKIRSGIPFIKNDSAGLDERQAIIEEGSLRDSLYLAYGAGALAAAATMQATLSERGIEIDLTKEFVFAQLSAQQGLLPAIEVLPGG